MNKEKLLPLSIICLSISLVISSIIISKGIKESLFTVADSFNYGMNNMSNSIKAEKTNSSSADKDLMTVYEAGVYLGIGDSNLINMINNGNTKIPYVKIEGNYVFSKKAIDKWIETQMKQ